jgi:hypothetical protein
VVVKHSKTIFLSDYSLFVLRYVTHRRSDDLYSCLVMTILVVGIECDREDNTSTVTNYLEHLLYHTSYIYLAYSAPHRVSPDTSSSLNHYLAARRSSRPNSIFGP